jgi:hypothetical protein
MRDQAADQYERQVRKPWRPRSGSMVNHRNLTATMIDSRTFIRNRVPRHEVLVPAGPHRLHRRRDYQNHRLIWEVLDRIHEKHPTWCSCTEAPTPAPN